MPAKDTLIAWLNAFNDTDPAALETYLAQHGLLAEAVAAWASFRRTAGPLALLRIESEASGVVRDRWDRYFKLTPAAEPFGMAFENAWPPDDALPQRMRWSELKERVEARLDDYAARDQFSGAVAVYQRGQPLLQRAYGFADREQKTPNTLDTRFRVGSMNKMLTGAATLQLAQNGALSLDDTVGKRILDYANRTFAERVTVQHLLHHTAGAGDFFGPLFTKHRLELRDPADYVKLYEDRDPEFEPGTKHKYANYGYILLGRLIELASGMTYDAFVEQHILAPTAMNATGALPETSYVPGRAVGYMDSPTGLARNDDTLPFRGTPAGGGYSTVGDLVRFAEALNSGALLDTQHMHMIASTGFEVRPGVRYGAGFMQFERDGVRSFGHDGGAPGMNGSLVIFPDTGFVVAVLSNGDPPQAASVSDFIAKRLPL